MSQVNKEEALRALDIAKKRLQSSELASSDLAAALRFAKKSSSLYPTSESASVISKIESLIQSKGHESKDSSSSSSASKGKQNGDTPSTADGIRNRFTKSSEKTTTSSSSTSQKEESREYTKEQVELVKRVKKCNGTAYYEILQLEKTCKDTEIKKAYKKLALQLHPDKNCAPGADEAFKLVSKAFQVLQDPDSRSHYDRFGADRPSMSSTGSSASPGFRTSHAQFEEVNPDEIFRMFFGNGGFGGPGFGSSGFGGPGFTTFYGPGGVRTTRFGGGMGGMPRRTATQNDNNENRSSSLWIQLLPLLVLAGFSFISQLSSSIFNWSEVPDPSFSFQPTSFHTLARSTFTTPKVDYFVNARQFGTHSIYKDVLEKNSKLGFYSNAEPGSSSYSEALFKHIQENNPIPQSYDSQCQPPTAATRKHSLSSPVPPVCFKGKFSIPSSLNRYERKITNTYLTHLKSQCQDELENKRDLLNRYRGFFGVGADWQKFEQVQKKKLESCEKLNAMGYTIQTY